MQTVRLLIGLFILLSASALLNTACGAEDETRRGGLGEFCNGRDDDCQTGLACLDGVCDEFGPKPTYSCEEMCARLDECGAGQSGCVPDCRATTSTWSLAARNAFSECFVEDITCMEALVDDVPQLCYSQLPLSDDRKQRCDTFVSTASNCGATDAERDDVFQSCYELARTGTDSDWAGTDRCVNALDVGICSGIGTCFNDELGTNISLAD